MNGNKLQKSIPKGGLCLKLYSNWMCSSSGEMPKKRYKYISISLWLLLVTLQKEREKMQQLSVHIKPAERCLVFRSQTPAASETHRPPRCPRNRALSPSTPSQVCGDASPLTPVTMSRPSQWDAFAPCPSFPSTSRQKMNLPLARYQISLSLLTPTARHVTLEAPSLEKLYGTGCDECHPRWARWGPLRGHRSVKEPQLPSQGRRPSRAAAWHSFFSFPLLA